MLLDEVISRLQDPLFADDTLLSLNDLVLTSRVAEVAAKAGLTRGEFAVRSMSHFIANASDGEWLAYPGAPDEELYTNAVLPYYRAPHIFLGFPARFRGDRGSMVEPLLMSSRDGRTFHRREEALIRPGPNPDRWMDRSNYVWWGLEETASDLPGGGKELSLYTNECSKQSDRPARTRRYTCRIDGFVSLNAPLSGGEVVSKPLTFTGGRLTLNVATSVAGSVRVELQSADGKALDGFGADECDVIYGDDLDRVVRWKAGPDVGALQGRPVRLRFLLQDADVFSFRFGRCGGS